VPASILGEVSEGQRPEGSGSRVGSSEEATDRPTDPITGHELRRYIHWGGVE